jgi:hypothetical protein
MDTNFSLPERSIKTMAITQGTQTACGVSPEILGEIYQPSVNVVIWQRVLKNAVASYSFFLLEQNASFRIQQILNISQIRTLLRNLLPDSNEKNLFIEDIALVVEMFSLLFESDEIGLRLHCVSGAPCPAFHNDRIPCRLLLTYHGEGSQWLDESNLNRDALATVESPSLDENNIHSIAVGHVALFKGEGWEGNEGNGWVHRSPPQPSHEKRLVLTLDLSPG